MFKGLDYIINFKDGNFAGAKKAKEELNGLDNAVDNTGRNINGLGNIVSNVGGLIAGAFAVSEILAFGNASVAAYKDVQMASAQAQAGIISTAGAAGRSLADFQAQANELENTTLFGDDQVLNAQAMLVTFTKVKGEIFDQAIPAIADMAQRMAGDGPADLKGASIQVGKALNDPIKGISALSRVGVTFTEQQKATIASMVEQNNIAGAQALILAELNTEFGGSAAAARDAAGAKADFTVAVGNLQEGFGALLNTGLDPFYGVMTSIVTVIADNIGLISTLALEIGGAAVVYGVVTTATGLYSAYQAAAAATTGGLTVAQWALNAALTANPVGVVVVGIGALIAGFTIAYQKSETFRGALDGVLEVGKLLGTVFTAVGKTILGALTFDKDMFVEGVKESIAVAQNVATGGVVRAFKKGFDDSIAQSRKDAAEAETQTANNKFAVKPGSKGIAAGIPAKALSGGAKSAEATTVASNKQVRNVNVTIGKLVENLTVATTNMQGAGTADIKRIITEILTGAVRDSELALSAE